MAINTNYYNYNASYMPSINSNSTTNTNNSLSNLYNTSQTSYNKSVSYGKNTAAALTSNVQSFLSNAKLSAYDLKLTLNNMLGTSKILSSFNNTAVSSNKDLLNIKSADNKKLPNSLNTNIQIIQTAATQKNKGASLTANKSAIANGFSSGTQSMKLTVGNKSFNIGFSVASGDTNKDVQEKIAESINSKNAGVKAYVEHDSKNNKSSLVVESTDTGIVSDGQVKFELSSMSGNALAKTGIASVSQFARNAVYNIDGGAQITSKTNNVDIGNGITATLKAIGTAEVTLEKDTGTPINDVTDMVKNYNKLLEAAENNKSDRRTNALHTQLVNTAKSYSGALSDIGINVDADGYMSVNEKKLQTASENGNLEKFMTESKGKNYGFAARMQNIADRVDKNPASFATISYQKQADAINLNAYQSMRYSKYESVGLFFQMVL